MGAEQRVPVGVHLQHGLNQVSNTRPLRPGELGEAAPRTAASKPPWCWQGTRSFWTPILPPQRCWPCPHWGWLYPL